MQVENKHLQQKGLKVVILSQLLVEAMEDVRDTTMYKGKVKQFGNNFANLLKMAIKQNDAVYMVNPEIATNLYNELDGLVDKLAGLDIHGLIMIKQMYDHYSENKEDWESCFNLELTELNK